MKRMSVCLAAAMGSIGMMACGLETVNAKQELNLAAYATPAASHVSGHETLGAINDGFEPKGAGDHDHGCYGNWPRSGTQWVDYEWERPITTARIDVYWWDDGQGVRLPAGARLLAWDGAAFAPVAEVGVAEGRYNTATFPEITTTRLRLEMDGREKFSTGIIEWKVYDSGNSPKFAPSVEAGVDCIVLPSVRAHLAGRIKGPADSMAWSQDSGPGAVSFSDVAAAATTAEFPSAGTYRLRLAARNGECEASDTLTATTRPPRSSAAWASCSIGISAPR